MMGLAATGMKKAREKSCNLVAQIFFYATKSQQDNKHSLDAVSQTQPTHKRKSMGKFVCIGCRREFLKAHGLKIHLAKTDCGSFYDELANYNKDLKKDDDDDVESCWSFSSEDSDMSLSIDSIKKKVLPGSKENQTQEAMLAAEATEETTSSKEDKNHRSSQNGGCGGIVCAEKVHVVIENLNILNNNTHNNIENILSSIVHNNK